MSKIDWENHPKFGEEQIDWLLISKFDGTATDVGSKSKPCTKFFRFKVLTY